MGLFICNDKLKILEEVLAEAGFLEIFLLEQFQRGLVEDVLQMFKLTALLAPSPWMPEYTHSQGKLKDGDINILLPS